MLIKVFRVSAVLGCAVLVVSCLAGAALLKPAQLDRNRFYIKSGQLMRGASAFTIRGITMPGLLEGEGSLVEPLRRVNRVAHAGGTAVCFDLPGIEGADADGGLTLKPEVAGRLRKLVDEINWRRFAPICRVFTDGASGDVSWRLAAARAVANALREEDTILYWIDGPECALVVAAFREAAPGLTVIAPQGGDMAVVHGDGAAPAGQPVLRLGVEPEPLGEPGHFLLGAEECWYEALEKASMLPEESLPWEPDNRVLSPEEQADGWIALFDGQTLNGWVPTGNRNSFTVKDGTIQLVERGGNVMRTRDRYANFILRLQWRINKGGNSGIMLRASRTGRTSKVSMEFQLMGDSGTDPHKNGTGAIYDVLPPLVNAAKPEGEWNDLEVTLRNNHFKAVMNGQVVQDTDLYSTDELRTRLNKGFIALQDHGHPASFQNIRIKVLD